MKYFFVLFIAFISIQCSPKLSPDYGWGNQRWIVTELKGVPVQQSDSRRDAFLSFNAGEKRYSGNGGCNQVSGNYTLSNNNIHFGEITSTKMSCNDIEFENVLLATLGSIDRYEVNGGELSLKTKRAVMIKLRIK